MGNLAYGLVDGGGGPLSLCQEFYRKSSVFPGNSTFDFDPRIDKGRRVRSDGSAVVHRGWTENALTRTRGKRKFSGWKTDVLPPLLRVCFHTSPEDSAPNPEPLLGLQEVTEEKLEPQQGVKGPTA